jgi:predicted transcriptional regulator
MIVVRVLAVSTCILLLVLFAAPTSFGSAVQTPSAGAPDVSIVFPAYTGFNQSTLLSAFLAQRMQLGALVQPATFWNTTQDLVDGLGNSVPRSAPLEGTILQQVVTVSTTTGAVVEVHYGQLAQFGGQVAQGNGSFIYAEVQSSSLFHLNQTPISTTLHDVAISLGIPLNGSEIVVKLPFADPVGATLYRPLNSTPVEYANQLEGAVPISNSSIPWIRIFPWFVPTAAPSITEGAARLRAFAYINSTYGSVNFTYSRGYSHYALDPRTYRLAYSFHLLYRSNDFALLGDRNYTVWVDTQTGEILFLSWWGPIPATSGPPGLPLQSVALAAALGAIVLLLVYGVLSSEAASMAVFLAVAYPFFRLRKERSLDHFVRGRIYEYVGAHPGATFTDVKQHLSANNGEAAYHLMVLEKMGLLVSRRNGKLRCFFRSDAPLRLIETALTPLQYSILEILAGSESTQADLARGLHVSRQRLAYNVKALRKAGLVTESDTGRLLRVTASGMQVRDSHRTDAALMGDA